MFIGRERELDALNKLYKSNKFEFAVIYGRRRVGKTALINEFIGDKKAIYFMGVESNAKQNLENFSKSIMEFANGIETESSFLSFQAALEYVFKLAENERIILAIDEYPYVARSSKSLASTLQLLIDKYKDTSKLMLILCGSSMSYMEDHVLAYKAPLYGRRTAQMKILPFDFEETCRYFKNLSEDSIPYIPTQVEVQLITIEPEIPEEEIDRVKARLREFTDRANSGEMSFSTLARLYSKDPSSAPRGGETGFRGKGFWVPEFANVAFNLSTPGKISKIVETEFGYHIIQLIEKRGDRVNVRHILLQPEVAEDDASHLGAS